MSANLYYVDLYNGRIATEQGQPVSFPEVVAGGTLTFALRFLEYSGTFTEKDQSIAALRVGIGAVDQRPLTGQYRLKLGLGTTSTEGVNLTAFLDAGAKAIEVEAALNALSGKQSPFTCMDVPGAVMIRRTDGAAEVISVTGNRLVPVSFGRVTGVLTDGEWSYELRLTVAPLAFADSTTRVLPDPPSIKTIVEGGADGSNTFVWNEIQELYVPEKFKGTYQIRYGQFSKTTLLDRQDGPTQIEQAINAMLRLPDGTVLGTVQVTNPVKNYAHIEFGGDLAGTDVEEMTVSVFSAPAGDWTFDLPLDRAEMFFALREAEVLTLPFEAEADFYINPANPSAGTRTRKLWQTTIRVRRPQIMPDLATVPGIDWLRANPTDYIPFTPNQIVSGPQIYSTVLGNGTSTSFSVAHGLDTTAIANIVVRQNSAAWTALTEGVDYNATITNANSVQLAFGTAPANNGLLVYVQGAPAARQWDPHTHTQAQVVGLTGLLDNMVQRITVLENLLPKAGAAGAPSGGPPLSFDLPEVGEILPDVNTLDTSKTLASQIIVNQNNQQYPGGTELAATQEQLAALQAAIDKDPDALPANVLYRLVIPGVGATGVKGRAEVLDKDGRVLAPAVPEKPSLPALWPARSAGMAAGNRWPMLLPAQVGVSQAASTLPVFGTATPAGSIWVCTDQDGFVLPGGGGRKSQKVAAGEYFASDGRALYKVVPETYPPADYLGNGTTAKYFPQEMERELWRVFLGEEQFPLGANLFIRGELRTRMLGDFFDDDARGIGRVDYGAQYLLKCEAVPVFGTAHLGDIATGWSFSPAPVLLGQTRMTLSPALEVFSWSLSIRREALGMVSAWTAYRNSTAGADFALPATIRLRLTNFDMDDASPDPRGQVALVMPFTRLEVTV